MKKQLMSACLCKALEFVTAIICRRKTARGRTGRGKSAKADANALADISAKLDAISAMLAEKRGFNTSDWLYGRDK